VLQKIIEPEELMMTTANNSKSMAALPLSTATGTQFCEALGLPLRTNSPLRFSRLPETPFGVEVRGVDWSRPDEESARLISIAMRRHLLLVLRGQPIATDEQLDTFFRGLGRLVLDTEDGRAHYGAHIGMGPASEEKKKMQDFLSRKADNTGSTYYNPGGEGISELAWHNDQYHKPMLKIVSVFEALEVEPNVVPTEFRDTYTAYEMMPTDLRAALEHKNIIYFDPRLPPPSEMPRLCDSMHPIFQAHPHSGRKSVLVNDFSDRIAGVNRAESDAMLKEVRDYLDATAPKLVHQWTSGDMVVWDNIGLQHRRDAVPPLQKRKMRQYGGLAE